MAAEGYMRASGRMAAVCVTTGPGGTNAITGVMGAWVDSVPMFVISGQVKHEYTIDAVPDLNLRQLGDQEFDIIDSVRNMTKYAVMVTNPQEIAYHLEKALYLALSGRCGPVWLDIPMDVQGARVETDDLIHFNPKAEYTWGEPAATDAVAKLVAKLIHEAQAPLVLVGTEVRIKGAEERLREFLDRYDLPAVVELCGNGTVACDNPHYVGMPGTFSMRAANFAVQNCDLLLSIGCTMDVRMVSIVHGDFAKNAFKIAVDIDPRELHKPTVKVDLPINADYCDFLDRMLALDYTPNPEHARFTAWCRSLMERFPVVLPEYHNDGSKPLNPYVFIDELFKQLEPSDCIVTSNGSAFIMTFQAAYVKTGQIIFSNSGCASMGYGLPAAVGAAVSLPDKRIICMDDDGSIMMNLQELETIVFNHLNIKIFLINNDGSLSIKQTQQGHFPPPMIGVDPCSGVGFPKFEKIAEAFGLAYCRITAEPDCERTIAEFLAADGAGICEVMVRPEQFFAPKCMPRTAPDGSIVPTPLDDMAPFLDIDEYRSIRYC